MPTENTLTAKEWLIANWDNYPDRKTRLAACAKATKKAASGIRAAYLKILESGKSRGSDEYHPHTQPVAILDGNADDIIESELFLKRLDVPGALKEILKAVGNNFIFEDKLRRRVLCTNQQWKDAISLTTFDDNHIAVTDHATGKRAVVWSSKAGIAQAKTTLSMGRYE